MSDDVQETSVSGEQLMSDGEAALVRGDSNRAYQLLQQATVVGVSAAILPRLAAAYALAGRYQNRHADVLAWIEQCIAEDPSDPAPRSVLLRARVAVCRQLDLKRVLELAEEALAAAEEAGDEVSYASVLSNAAFAGYRRGDLRVAQDYAERAATRTFTTASAHYDAVRAQMFCATALGELEAALNFATKARAMAREQNRPADAANESNNLAESYLELGCPAEALACAQAAVELARKSGHLGVELFGNVLIALATAEGGDIDDALDQFDNVESLDTNKVFAVDAATVHSYWLLERGAASDAERARVIAENAVQRATDAGVTNRMTSLYSNIARACSRDGDQEQALEALEMARKHSDRGEPRAIALFSLAVAEVLPVSRPKRRVALTNARARILRSAARREDPHAFCTRIRLHRRLLELSGGVPDDLPESM